MEQHGILQPYHETTGYTDLLVFQLPIPNVGANSLELTTYDHEVLRYYRTSFSEFYHTKNPRYSLFSVMLTVAERSPIVMHLILALAGREIDLKRRDLVERVIADQEEHRNSQLVSKPTSRALQHYSTALGLMAEVVGHMRGPEAGGVDPDCVLTALYLMLMYERMFGSQQGVANHLAGAAIIVGQHCADLARPRLLAREPPGGTTDQQIAFSRTAQPGCEPQISQYSARLLVRVAFIDAQATSYGIGGEVIGTLYKAMGRQVGSSTAFSPQHGFESLEQYAVTLYRNVWGESYPQTELAEDIENRPVFALLSACLQIRFMISQLSNMLDRGEDARQPISSVHYAIQATGEHFAGLLAKADGLPIATDGSRCFVANLRFIVPYYHSVILEFLRLTAASPGLELDGRQRDALRGIMNLAVQAFRHEGNKAMLRIACPLFMVALETDDVLHREWVLERFKGLANFGARFERAREFLLRTIDMQQIMGRRVDLQERFRISLEGII